jgi:hypothetical protein
MRIRLAAVLLATFAQATLAQSESHDWTGYRNERFGFSLRYPADVLQPEQTSEAGDGKVFVSRAGDARLLVGVLPNNDRQSPAAYQDYVDIAEALGEDAGWRGCSVVVEDEHGAEIGRVLVNVG